MHLKPEELIDLAEGAAAETAFPHLGSCAACRQQLSGLRATISKLASIDQLGDVPEPPPFFWDRLQPHVADGVAAEPARSPLRRWLSMRPPVVVPFSLL